MPIERASVPPLPEAVGSTALPSAAGDVSLLEQKTDSVGEKTFNNGVLPDKFPPLVTREFTRLSKPLPLGLSQNDLIGVVGSIMKTHGISGGPAIGAEAVALHRLSSLVNRLCEGSGYQAPIPRSERLAIHTKEGKEVNVILTDAGATVTGIEKDQLLQLLEELKDTNPNQYAHLQSLLDAGKLVVVSKDELAKIDEIAEDKFSQIATALSDSLSEKVETDDGKVAGSRVGHRTITTISVDAVVTNGIAQEILMQGFRDQKRSAEHVHQERQLLRQQEEKDIRKEELKKHEKMEAILKEDIVHYALETDVEKLAAVKSREKTQAVGLDRGDQDFNRRVGVSEELREGGVATPPPSTPRAL